MSLLTTHPTSFCLADRLPKVACQLRAEFSLSEFDRGDLVGEYVGEVYDALEFERRKEVTIELEMSLCFEPEWSLRAS